MLFFRPQLQKEAFFNGSSNVDVVGLNGSDGGGTNAPNRNNITHVNDTPEDDGLIFSWIKMLRQRVAVITFYCKWDRQ